MTLPKYFGSSICQILETQRSMRSILKLSKADNESHHQNLGVQSKDFYGQKRFFIASTR